MRNLWLKWTLNCGVGELLGIASAATLAFGINYLVGEPDRLGLKFIVLGVAIISGVIEGSLLSFFQWRVLVEKIRGVPKNQWYFYTVLVAVLGWFFGTLPSLFLTGNSDSIQQFDWTVNPFNFVMLSLLLGLIMGTFFGLFQWFELRKHAKYSKLWILYNAFGWALALVFIFLFASIPHEGSSIWFALSMGAIGGILAGLSVGAITGIALLKIKDKEDYS